MPNLGPGFPEINRIRRPAPIRHQNLNRRQFDTKIRSGANQSPVRLMLDARPAPKSQAAAFHAIMISGGAGRPSPRL